jgi:hypothetical protein
LLEEGKRPVALATHLGYKGDSVQNCFIVSGLSLATIRTGGKVEHCLHDSKD